ncbi:MAG TPA: FecR domain-containing protein [Caulobacteraceae bacterium]|nr:FecR domain-containing protein [Caulobacteraceae bacterium]
MSVLPAGESRTVEETAADWFALRRSGPLAADDAQAFEAWLAADPEHRAAYDNLEHYWQAAAAVREDPQVLAMRDAADRRWRIRRAVVLGGAMAASLAVLVFAAVWLWSPVLISGRQNFHTAVGQTQTVMLPDGSAVTLDTDTVMRVHLDGSERRINLEKGRAYFRVAHDASRPFRVVAAGRTVTALGTVFEVRADPKRFEVTLVEGRVRVEEPPKRLAARPAVVELTPGAQLVSTAEKSWAVAETDVARETSWLDGRLAFDNDPLATVVAEMNRYSDKKIVIRDPAVANTPVLGVFKAGDVDAFVRAVESYRFARVGAETETTVELIAPT